MINIFQVLHTRLERKEKYYQSPLNYKTGIIASILLSLLSTFICIICFISYTELTHNLPSIEQLPQMIEPPGGLMYHPTQLYDRTGTHIIFTLENPASIKRQYLSIDKNRTNHIPQWIVDATILIKDPNFWSHPGFQRFYPSTNEDKTLAETIVSNFLFWDEPVKWKKDLQTKFLAARITYQFGRERLLEWYLNSLNFGSLAYGVDSAAYIYFGKSGNELSLAESAMLVGISEIPI
ncbi:MAG: transglycosylase domain-containing protein, partial [Chloroflexota bacterium]